MVGRKFVAKTNDGAVLINQKMVSGVIALTGRGFFVRVLSFFSLGFLGAFLTREEFGTFFLVSAVVNFLVYFSDIGLAAALVQKKENVTDNDLKTTFTIQQTLVVTLLILLFVFSSSIQDIYNLTDEAVGLMWALGFSFFTSSLKTIPSILLERDLQFNRWVLPQLIEDIVYNLLVVLLAWRGMGIASFSYAVVARSLVGLVVVYFLRPWVPGLLISRDSLVKLLKFGIPYQINTFLAVLKDDGLTIVLGGVLGAGGVGVLGWAQKWAQIPLRLFMDTVTKVSFPVFSRLQEDHKALAKSTTKSIFFICFLVFPSIVGICTLAPVLIDIVPRYDKWRVALLPLFLVSINVFFAASTTQLTNLLNAIGKIKLTFKLMIMWTILTWLLIPILAINFGVVGASLGFALVGASSLVALHIAHVNVPFDLKEAIFEPAVAAGIMASVMWTLASLLPRDFAGVFINSLLGVSVYVAVLIGFKGKVFVYDVKKLFNQIIKR